MVEEEKQLKNEKLQMILFVVLLVAMIGLEFIVNRYFVLTLEAIMIKNSIMRLIGGIFFIWILVQAGYGSLFKFTRPVKAILIMLPALLISGNNFPIIAYFDSRAILLEPVQSVYIFILECISIGFFEEIIFRGMILLLIMQRLPKTKKGVFQAIVISSIVFGLVHSLNLFAGASISSVLLQIGYSFLMGMMWSVLFLATKNIWFTMILHASYNFFGLVLFQLGSVSGRYDVVTLWTTILLAVLVAIYSSILFMRLKVTYLYNE